MVAARLAPLLILAIGSAFLTAGDIVFKTWTQAGKPGLYAVGLACYIIGLLFLVASYKTTNIAVASAIFILANLIFLAVVSWVWFKEPLNTTQVIGMLFALAAVIMFELA